MNTQKGLEEIDWSGMYSHKNSTHLATSDFVHAELAYVGYAISEFVHAKSGVPPMP